MEFDVAVPGWWTPAAAVTAIFAVPYLWFWAGRHYPHSPLRRLATRLFGCATGVALPILMYAGNSTMVRVRGDQIEVRGRFEREFKSYALSDVSSFDYERVRFVESSATRWHTELVVVFRDGHSVAIHEGYVNYERLGKYLADNGIRQR